MRKVDSIDEEIVDLFSEPSIWLNSVSGVNVIARARLVLSLSMIFAHSNIFFCQSSVSVFVGRLD